MEYEILEKYKDSDGRLIIIKCKFKNTNYIISNCYGQTQQYKNYQLNFIQLARNYLYKFENENINVPGDFNLYLDPKLDKSNSTFKDMIILIIELKLMHFLKAYIYLTYGEL